jgi:tRNA dimethylallyltransferase
MSRTPAAPRPRIIVLAGPTAAGKSRLAVLLAGLPGMPAVEIICADSRQIYRGMDIGTDKTDPGHRCGIPHHLLDIIDPDTRFSAADFAASAGICIQDVIRRKALPVIVGGTGLYIRALTCGLVRLSGPVSHSRTRYSRFLEKKGPAALFELLRQRDEQRSRNISPSDTFRVIRALELLDAGTADISRALSEHGFDENPYHSLKFFLTVDRDKLYTRIDARVDAMIEKGLIQEVAALRNRFGEQAPALSGIGYSQIGRYLDGELTLEEVIRIIKRDTRHYAKRQITWFRKEPGIEMLPHDPDNPEKTLMILGERIRRFHDS